MAGALIRSVALGVAAAVATAGGLHVGSLGVRDACAERRGDPSLRVRKRLARGRAQFEDLEYRRALRTLAPVPEAAAATRAQRLSALELIAMSHLILGNKRRAKQAFQKLLDIDPGYQLRDDTGSPKIRVFFDAVKRNYGPGLRGSGIAELEHAAPRSATAGRRLELAVKVGRGRGSVKEVVVHTRRRGVLTYSKPRSFVRRGRGWRVRFTVPAARTRYILEYYIEARDLTGRAIGRIGGPASPLTLRITPGGQRRTRWYRRWWAIAGGVAVGAGAAIWLTSGGGVSDGSLPPGRITLTP